MEEQTLGYFAALGKADSLDGFTSNHGWQRTVLLEIVLAHVRTSSKHDQ